MDQILYVLLASGVVLTVIPHKKTMSVTNIPRPTFRNKRLGYSTALISTKNYCLVNGNNYANDSIQNMKRKKRSHKNRADMADYCCCVCC
jgi:hypothetical protein